MPPPTGVDNRTSAAVDRRAWKAARRSVVVQCDRCACIGTGQINARRRLTSVNLAARRSGLGQWTHLDCGGIFRAYDIETTS